MFAYPREAQENAEETREKLILEHLPQVHLLARRIHRRLPGNVSLDDLISTGTLGLISAIDNYDSSMGVKLKTYAEYKIRGAILDSLRSLDWASRYRRKKAKDIESAMHQLQQRLKRQPEEDEVAAEMGITLAQYHARLRDVQGLDLQSLDFAPGNHDPELLTLLPDEGELPSETLERAELERLIAKAIEEMPETQRTILALYYQEELTLKEISEIVKICIPRVSVLKTHSVMQLRSLVRARWGARRTGSE